MSALEATFVSALSVLLVGVVLFGVYAVRGALLLTRSPVAGGWAGRIGRVRERDVQRWAYVAHRVSGVAVFAFLLLHVCDVALYAVSRRRFDELHHVYATTTMRVFECLLLSAILFHTFNGLRLVVLDAVELSARVAQRLLLVAVSLTVVLGLVTGALILRPAL
ncbi:MAG TPA: succinate dehydrogenase, cytochrome b556 subunit [Gaiellaceae bacterium]|nr:succinate dehydrogenase, cytochrome b556 subunit [Gaiellaceae bacterium]